MREHPVAQGGDEVRLRGCFAEGGDHVAPAGIDEGRDGATDGEGGAFDPRKWDVAGIIWGRARQDGEGVTRWRIMRFQGWMEDGV